MPKKSPIILSLDHEELGQKISKKLFGEIGSLIHKTFPDGETYIRVQNEVRGREVIIVADLSRPNEKTMPLLLTALNCANLGAKRIGLVAPYLPYMRQDKIFNPGEAFSSRIFARLLNPAFDWLVTVDPHLHRIKSLNEIFLLSPVVISAAPKIADWIKENIKNPLILGPDVEKDTLVREVATFAQAPYVLAQNPHNGGQHLELSVPANISLENRNIVIVDDIVSKGATITKAVKAAEKCGGKIAKIICTHALFDPHHKDHNDKTELDVISTNTAPNANSVIDVHGLIAEKVLEFYLRKPVPAIHRLV